MFSSDSALGYVDGNGLALVSTRALRAREPSRLRAISSGVLTN